MKAKPIRIRAENQRVRGDFIKTDLETGLALAALAKTHYWTGNKEAGDRAREMATRAYEAVVQHLGQIEWSDEDVLWITEKRAELQSVIGLLQSP